MLLDFKKINRKKPRETIKMILEIFIKVGVKDIKQNWDSKFNRKQNVVKLHVHWCC